jgi:hypothetical protein
MPDMLGHSLYHIYVVFSLVRAPVLAHGDIKDTVVRPTTGPRTALHEDEISGIKKLYGGRTYGYLTFQLSHLPLFPNQEWPSAIGRMVSTAEVWWIAPDGLIQDAFRYEILRSWR